MTVIETHHRIKIIIFKEEVHMMNNAEVIKGIETVVKGLEEIKSALVSVEKTPVEKKSEVVKETPVMNEPEESSGDTYTMEQLQGMKYNEFKKLASSLGVKCTGTRDEILQRIVDLGVVEAEEEEDTDSEDTVTDEAVSAESYFEQFDPEGYNDPSDMTDERKEAVEAKMDSILTSYDDGTLTDDDITSYVEDNATDDEIELLGDDYDEVDVLKLYMELVKRTIDNDGEEHEQGEPYEVGERDLCCGHLLQYIKKSKKFVCEHCGTEYEAE